MAQRVPFPPDRGDKLAAYHAVRFLARRHSVTVAAPAVSSRELDHAEALRAQGVEVEVVRRGRLASGLAALAALATGEPLSLAYYHCRELSARIAARARQAPFDVAVSFSSSTGPYVTQLESTPLVADFVDLDSRKWESYARSRRWPWSWLYALEARRLLRYERRLAERALRTFVRTEAEKEDCVRLIPGGRFEVLANGVDLEYFRPPAAPPSGQGIVFTGVMDYHPNVDAVRHFCDAILPRVRERAPDAVFTIVGARPNREVRALARRPGVVVTGTVPDVRPLLHAARVAVAPLRLARGIQNKVLEAMAAGLPAVTTSAVRRGIGAADGEGLLVADRPDDFADRVVSLLRDPAFAAGVAARGRRYVERACVWEDNLEPLRAIIEQVGPSTAPAPSLLVTENFPPRTGGSSRWFHELYRRLGPERFLVAAAEPADGDAQRSDGLRVHRLPLSLATWSVKSPRGLLAYGRAVRRLCARVRDSGVAMIHCGRPLPEGVMALAVRAIRGTPYLCYVHGEELAIAASSRELTWLVRRVLAQARGVIANSGNTARLLGEQWQVPSGKLRLLHPGVDTRHYAPAPRDARQRERLGWAGRRVVLTVGRLQRRKGQDNLIRALPRVRELVPDVLYAVVGEGEERRALEGLVRDLGVEEAVSFMGEVDDPTLLRCYQQCDLFVLPNRDVAGDFEGFGIVLIEAQACGKAVLAGTSGGTAETMRPGVSGRLVDGQSPPAIADAIRDLLVDPAHLARMGDAGRAWVVDQFDWSVLARRAEALFAGLRLPSQPASSSS